MSDTLPTNLLFAFLCIKSCIINVFFDVYNYINIKKYIYYVSIYIFYKQVLMTISLIFK